MSTSYHANLELILVDWIGALRDRDLARVAELLEPEFEHRWIDGAVTCANREQMVAWTAGRTSRAKFRVDGVEVVAGDADHVVMGVHGPDFAEVGGEHVGGRVYEVFTIRDGRIAAVRAYLKREAALDAAGVERASPARR